MEYCCRASGILVLAYGSYYSLETTRSLIGQGEPFFRKLSLELPRQTDTLPGSKMGFIQLGMPDTCCTESTDPDMAQVCPRFCCGSLASVSLN